MNTYLFTNGDSFECCGYEGDDPFGAATRVSRKGIRLTFNIPSGLNIISAKLILYHAPTLWGWANVDGNNYSGWGYCRNLKVYKATNINNRKYMAQYMSEYYETDDTKYSEINNALGTSGWTPTVPTSTTHNTEQKISTDIKSNLSVGINELLIQTGTEITGEVEPSEICSKSAFVYAMLKVDGYMSYE